MSDSSIQPTDSAVRASDAERELAVALLQRNFADGRLTQAELEERAGAAYAARTRAQLGDLTADLPPAPQRQARSGPVPDRRLLCVLLCIHPPAALIYWLCHVCARKQREQTRNWVSGPDNPWSGHPTGDIVG